MEFISPKRCVEMEIGVCVCVCRSVSPVVQVLCNDEVFEVVVDGPLIVMQEGVSVSKAVTGLSLHRPVFQLPSQLQRLPNYTPTTHTHPQTE